MPATVTDIGADGEVRVSDLTRIEDFLRTGKCKHEYQGGAVLRDRADDPFLCRDGELIQLSKDIRGDDTGTGTIAFVTESVLSAAPEHRGGAANYNDDYVELPAGVMVTGGPKGWKNILVVCGDEDYVLVEVKDGTPTVTISFLCLSRFLDDATPLELAAMLHRGKIKVLDFTADETRKVSAADKKSYDARKTVAPPELGFTYMADGETDEPIWHRAATVLLSSGRMRILIGQDDGTYFGCELKGAPGTVKDAFKSLMPEHIRKVRGVKRQGEWFVVPVAEKNVPAVTECVALTDEGIDLPVDDWESARHTVSSTDIRVARDGRIYALAGTLRHSEDDHPVVAMPNKWHSFVRNTAKRSFSQEGVD